jgi:hypothetical protein
MAPETVRWRAIECMQLAQKPAEPQHRALLLDLAHCWADLANAVERYQLFIEATDEAAEARSIDGARRKAQPRTPRAVRLPRSREGLNRSSSALPAGRQAKALSARGVARR